MNSVTRITVIVPLVIILVFAAVTLKNPAFIDESLETLFVDFRFEARNFLAPLKAPKDIIIVAIDEKSLKKNGRWPWSRKLQANLID